MSPFPPKRDFFVKSKLILQHSVNEEQKMVTGCRRGTEDCMIHMGFPLFMCLFLT
ncbi:uncharacterized protein DS421_6g180950 [Arachis hypogaea]|nr:uncharacterized protein DS421_6g180950 [Arachis hypogaea]